ncbi:thiamine biosynthesis protein ThiF [Sphingobacteriales bacterium UPWRP_1]|nr:thiamine biosynthesis protein ThiF [Sphingobacteriales bacterium UPWRP_1]
MENKYLRIHELGWNEQKLRQAKVLVAGAGALGNEVLKNLALLGVGNIWVADMDIIESHNLTRAVLFRESDVGQYKAEVAARRAHEINPDLQIQPVVKTVQEAFGLLFYHHIDLVFGCVDNVQARLDINRYCYQTQTLYIDAGIRMLDGDVKVFGAPYRVCFDCLVTQQMRDEAWQRFSCLKLRTRSGATTIPTAPTVSAIMAGFQVQIGVKYLHQAPIPLNRRITVLGNIDEMHLTQMSANPGCPTHCLYEPIDFKQVTLLPHASSELSAKNLLHIIRQQFNSKAVIQLDYDLITHFTCPEHNYRLPLLRRRGYVFADEVECPYCKKQGLPNSFLLMQENFTNQLTGTENEELLNSSLLQLGMPPCHLVTAVAMHQNRLQYRLFGFEKDNERYFGNMKT